jgi:hypothetical protein
MSDITDLFAAVAPMAEEPSPETVEADIARGHRALVRVHRRRLVRRSLLTTMSLAVVAIGVTASMHHGTDATGDGVGAAKVPATHAATHAAKRPGVPGAHNAPAVRLVAYTGTQLAGFTVDRVPDGWHLSTSTQVALNINRQGDTNNDPDVFEGKLTVLLQSRNVHGLPHHGTAVTIDGEPGVVTDQGRYGLSLTYRDTSRHTVVVQAPKVLAWSDSQVVQFAEGVHVTGDVVAPRG